MVLRYGCGQPRLANFGVEQTPSVRSRMLVQPMALPPKIEVPFRVRGLSTLGLRPCLSSVGSCFRWPGEASIGNTSLRQECPNRAFDMGPWTAIPESSTIEFLTRFLFDGLEWACE